MFAALERSASAASLTPGTTATARRSPRATSSTESNKYTVKLKGRSRPILATFMASLNSLSAQHYGRERRRKDAILPNPSLGGFTTSNPPEACQRPRPPRSASDGDVAPSPYGQAFVTSRTLDVYQPILLQTNTVFGFVRIPDPNIPRDLNILSFRMSSKYIRPGVLDGMIGYEYNPATRRPALRPADVDRPAFPSTTAISRRAKVGHHASYMRVVEAYQIKKQIDQNAFNTLALYQAITTPRALCRTRR